MERPALLMLFVDGIGIGRDDPTRNPFAACGARRLASLARRDPDTTASFVPIDATLGVDGLPQSPTGQTALFTGVNAPAHAGAHLAGLPGPTLRPLLERESIFLKLKLAGRRATFANAYTRAHLDAERPRWSASTRAVLAAGLPFRLWDEQGRDGRALFHDYTGRFLRQRGFAAAEHDAASAAEVLLGLLAEHDFVLYEYFLTDLAAHRGSWEQKVEQARLVEELVEALLARLGSRQTLLLTSDHGNLEEGDHKRHTRNPVPLLVWGHGRERLAEGISDLTGVAPAVLRFLGKGEPG